MKRLKTNLGARWDKRGKQGGIGLFPGSGTCQRRRLHRAQ